MPDNLNIKGIEGDEHPQGSRRIKARGKRRKPWLIEGRIQRRVTPGLASMMRLRDWGVYHRYPTKARRDQAYAALVKKAHIGRWFSWEYRKRDE